MQPTQMATSEPPPKRIAPYFHSSSATRLERGSRRIGRRLGRAALVTTVTRSPCAPPSAPSRSGVAERAITFRSGAVARSVSPMRELGVYETLWMQRPCPAVAFAGHGRRRREPPRPRTESNAIGDEHGRPGRVAGRSTRWRVRGTRSSSRAATGACKRSRSSDRRVSERELLRCNRREDIMLRSTLRCTEDAFGGSRRLRPTRRSAAAREARVSSILHVHPRSTAAPLIETARPAGKAPRPMAARSRASRLARRERPSSISSTRPTSSTASIPLGSRPPLR